MILLDTNVLSELMKPNPDPRVVQWLDTFIDPDVWVCAVTVSEIRLGLSLMPDGKRKNLLMELAEQMFQEEFSDRCLPFDCEAAIDYAQIVSQRRQQGRPISVEDAQIAAVARTAGISLATRNTKDFYGITGLELIDPGTEVGGRRTEGKKD